MTPLRFCVPFPYSPPQLPKPFGIHRGNLFKEIIKRMESLDYEVTTGVLLAANYGTPQLRQRLFFLGSRRGLNKIQLPAPTHSAIPGIFTLPYITVGEAFAGLPPLPVE